MSQEIECSALCKEIAPITFRDKCEKLCDNAKELNNDCKEGIVRLFQDKVKLEEVAYTSANLPLALSILLTSSNETMQASEAIQFISYGGISNLGDPDACKSISQMHYCVLTANAASPSASQPLSTSLGVCLPDQCFQKPADFQIASLPVMLSCGDHRHLAKDEVGSLVMLSLCGFLLILVMAGTFLEWWKERKLKAPDKQQEESDPPPLKHAGSRNIFSRSCISLRKGYEVIEEIFGEEVEDPEPEGYFPLAGGSGFAVESIADSHCGELHSSNASLQRLENPHDLQKTESNKWESFLLCFSLTTNLQDLFSTKRPSEFRCLDGVRAFSMLWVIFGHVVVFQLSGVGYSNLYDILPLDGHGFFSRFSAQVLPSAEFAVDTFFFISGFLVAVLMLKRLKEKPPTQSPLCWVPLAFFHRYLRLTPTVMFVIFFNVFVVVLLGNGPFWDGVKIDHKACTKHWWKVALYMTNYDNVEGLDGTNCYPVIWYLGVDFQLFLVAPFLLLLYRRNRRLGIGCIASLCVASIVYAWAIAYAYDISFNTFDPAISKYFNKFYSRPWTRCPPYFIGMLTAILWYEWEYLPSLNVLGGRPPTPFSFNQVMGLAAVSATLLGSTVYGCWTEYRQFDKHWGDFRDHAYLALSKPAWSIGVAIMCYLCFINQGGVVQQILEAPQLVPISRLCFTAYLAHPIILICIFCSRVTKLHFSTIEFTFTFLGASTGAILLAAGFYLMVEKPCRNLEKLSFPQK